MTEADEGVAVSATLEQADPATPIISARGVRKFYGHVEALRGVDLDLMPGEVHALVGDNGAGKSTLVKIIAGAIQATEGEVLLDGRRVHFTEPSEALAAGISTVVPEPCARRLPQHRGQPLSRSRAAAGSGSSARGR